MSLEFKGKFEARGIDLGASSIKRGLSSHGTRGH